MTIEDHDTLKSKKLKKHSKRKKKSIQFEIKRNHKPTKTPILRNEAEIIESDSLIGSSSNENVIDSK